jgi:hypothetical protein
VKALNLQKICCGATCLDLNSTYKLLRVNINSKFACEMQRRVRKVFGAAVVTTGGEMRDSIQLGSGVTAEQVVRACYL